MQFRVLSLLFCGMILSFLSSCDQKSEILSPNGLENSVEMRDGECSEDYDYLVGYVNDDGSLELLAEMDAWNETYNSIAERAVEASGELESVTLSTGESGDEIPYLQLAGQLSNGESLLVSIEGGICGTDGVTSLKVSTKWFIGCRGSNICSNKCDEVRNTNGYLVGCDCSTSSNPSYCRLSGIAFNIKDIMPVH